MPYFVGIMLPYNPLEAGKIKYLGLGPFDTMKEADNALDDYLRTDNDGQDKADTP